MYRKAVVIKVLEIDRKLKMRVCYCEDEAAQAELFKNKVDKKDIILVNRFIYANFLIFCHFSKSTSLIYGFYCLIKAKKETPSFWRDFNI